MNLGANLEEVTQHLAYQISFNFCYLLTDLMCYNGPRVFLSIPFVLCACYREL